MIEKRGKFIVAEGLDGSGKTEQVRLLTEDLRRRGIDIIPTQEHWRGDILGQVIHKIVELKEEVVEPSAVQLTFIGNRLNHTSSFIEPLLRKGRNVVSDRYLESNLAYAGETDREILIMLTEEFIRSKKILRPDLSILIDVPVDKIMDRLELRRRMMVGIGDSKAESSIFEKKPKLLRVRDNYLERFNKGDENMIIVDGSGTREEVHSRVVEEIQRRGILGNK